MFNTSVHCCYEDDFEAPFDYNHNQLKVGDIVKYDTDLVEDYWGKNQQATIISIDKKNDAREYNWRVMVKGSVLDNVEIRYYRWVKIGGDDANN